MMTEFQKRLGMSFSMKRGSLVIFWSSIQKLGDPRCIEILISKTEKHLAIVASNPLERNHLDLPENRDSQCEISGTKFIRQLYNLCGWDPDKNYRSYGVYVARERVIVYPLEDAEVIGDQEFEKEGLME